MGSGTGYQAQGTLACVECLFHFILNKALHFLLKVALVLFPKTAFLCLLLKIENVILISVWHIIMAYVFQHRYYSSLYIFF